MKNATLKAIVERIHKVPVDSLVWHDGMVYGGTASVRDEEILPPKHDYHLFLSDAHPESQMIASLLQGRFPSMQILVSNDPTPSCDWALIVLSDGAFDEPAYEPSVLSVVQHLGMVRVMLFYKGPACGGVPFSTLRQQCPERIKGQHPDGLGVLNKMASELMNNPRYREICLHKIAWNITQQGAEITESPPETDKKVVTSYSEVAGERSG